MGDLISRKNAINRMIEEAEKSQKRVIHINTIKRILQDIDTAYDVKKVVEELNKAESVKTFGSLNSGNRLIPVKDSINIVKKGGIPAAWHEGEAE